MLIFKKKYPINTLKNIPKYFSKIPLKTLLKLFIVKIFHIYCYSKIFQNYSSKQLIKMEQKTIAKIEDFSMAQDMQEIEDPTSTNPNKLFFFFGFLLGKTWDGMPTQNFINKTKSVQGWAHIPNSCFTFGVTNHYCWSLKETLTWLWKHNSLLFCTIDKEAMVLKTHSRVSHLWFDVMM